MADILFVTWGGGGNQTPAIGAAQALRARGHRVSFAGYQSQRARFAGLGLAFSVLDSADAAWVRGRAHEPVMKALARGVFACPEHLQDVAAALARRQPDLIIVDCLMFGAIAAVEGLSWPAAVLAHSAPGALVPPGGPLERTILGPVRKLRVSAGLPPLTRLWDAWSPFAALCATLPQLEPWTGQLPPSFAYLGPVFEQAGPRPWQSPWPAGDRRPLILVSFSTGDAWDQRIRIEKTLTGLAAAPCRVLATTGRADVSGLDVPANAIVRPWVPHSQVMPHVALTISHGGHGTLCASLAEGAPMVLIPNPAADQPALAARAAALGAAHILDGDTTPTEIGDAVNRVLQDNAYQKAASNIARAIRSAGQPNAIVSKIEALL
jgi:UDP:flavonoid glycosyltransferase YjiC (YdhE family)